MPVGAAKRSAYSGTPRHQLCRPNAMKSRPPSTDMLRSLMWGGHLAPAQHAC